MRKDAIDIYARRKIVKQKLDEKGFLTYTEIAEIAQYSGYSTHTIKSDILVLVNGSVFHTTPQQRKRIFERDNYICYICGVYDPYPIVEHKIPFRLGGTNSDTNLFTCCASCNIKKAHTDAASNPNIYWTVKKGPFKK